MTDASPLSSPRILVVEDEGIIAADIEATLEDYGYVVTGVAVSADEALAEATRLCPDLVLMDIRIRGKLDGIETASLLHHRFGVPIVFLTAHGDAATLARAKAAAPMAYLLKPFKKAELFAAVEVALRRHELEQQLRERSRWLATTMASIGDAVLSTDENGGINFLNPEAERLTGWTAAEATGRPVEEVLHLRDARTGAAIEAPVRQVLRDGRSIRVADATIRDRVGMEHPIADSVTAVEDATRRYGAVMVMRDETDRRVLQRRVDAAERMASLGTLATGVGHEISNPLTFITGNLGHALELVDRLLVEERPIGVADADTLRELRGELESALTGALRVGEIVKSLRRMSPRLEEAGASADVVEAIEWAIQMTTHEWRYRARIVRELEPVPRVLGQDGCLGQVLMNLLVNAAHAIPEGAPDAHTIRVLTRRAPDRRIVVEVRDSGSGMSAEVRRRAFEPFFTTKDVGAGTGLGLSICHGLVQAMRGEIEIESEPGRGTTVRLHLVPAPRPRTPSAPASVVAPGGPARILSVDDERLIGVLAQKILEGRHQVVNVTSGSEALARLRAGETFELILCDMGMPGMGGAELYRRLLAERPELAPRVLFVTGGAVSVEDQSFLARVRNPRLLKPFSVAELRDAVEAALIEVRRVSGAS